MQEAETCHSVLGTQKDSLNNISGTHLHSRRHWFFCQYPYGEPFYLPFPANYVRTPLCSRDQQLWGGTQPCQQLTPARLPSSIRPPNSPPSFDTPLQCSSVTLSYRDNSPTGANASSLGHTSGQEAFDLVRVRNRGISVLFLQPCFHIETLLCHHKTTYIQHWPTNLRLITP